MEALLEEVERLRAGNAQLRKANNFEADDSAPFRFLDVPKDVRSMIYEYLVVPGTITLRYKAELAKHDNRYAELATSLPSYGQTQIFAVCGQIKDEALPLYISKNLFIWPAGGQNIQPLFAADVESGVYGDQSQLYMRRLSVSLDYRDVDFRQYLERGFKAGRSDDWSDFYDPIGTVLLVKVPLLTGLVPQDGAVRR
ncbi:hypothetical protein LTR85_005606 [Meristemomyces frigidus]|nr:hypothetical protein LTR85_005606 [Meristemomyces frigidus]